MLNEEKLKKWVDEARQREFGFYLLNANDFTRRIKEIRDHFSMISQFELAYSIKANYCPELLQEAVDQGLSFDLASLNEWEKVNRVGANSGKCWFTSPYINERMFLEAIAKGIHLHVESKEQLLQVGQWASSHNVTATIGLRFQTEPESRFGIPSKQEDLIQVADIIHQSSFLKLRTLHMHNSTEDRSASNIAKRLDLLLRIYGKYFKTTDIDRINMGGGFASSMPNELKEQFSYQVPDWEQYAKAIGEVWNAHKVQGLRLVIEPGMALVADLGVFIARVVAIRVVEDKKQAVLNTSKLFLKPGNHSKELVFTVINARNSNEKSAYELVGMTCMESDRIGRYIGSLEVNDVVIFKNMGAYTSVLAPSFIFPAPEQFFS